jgi:fucose permease
MLVMQKKETNYYAIVIIGILFFVFGFVTWLNGTLIPFLKLACQLENDVVDALQNKISITGIHQPGVINKPGTKGFYLCGIFIQPISGKNSLHHTHSINIRI